VKLNFTIIIQNKNDPPNEPRIINPLNGQTYKFNQTIALTASGSDPDTVYGQVLNFTWSVNGTPRWYGSSKTVTFQQSGNFTITLTVSDGEFQKSVSVNITISPKETVGPTPVIVPPKEKEEFPYALVVGIIVVVCIALLIAFLVVTKRREEEKEAAEETDEKREAFKRMAEEVKATADQMEAELATGGTAGGAAAGGGAGGAKPGAPGKVVVEQRAPGGGAAMVTSEGMEERMLTMKPQETEAASKETMQLFKDMSRAEVPAQDAEQMRVDNEKRKYATAIGRMPYGIPSAELKNRDWNELAAALATGQKKTLPDGREVTAISGRWYYSDPGDSSSFLKEHGAKPKMEVHRPAPAAAAPAMDRATIIAKLEERLALGEISEETYRELKRKYEAAPEAPKKTHATDEWEETAGHK